VALKREAGGENERQAVTAFIESMVEDAAFGWLEALGCAVLHGPPIPGRSLAALILMSKNTQRDEQKG